VAATGGRLGALLWAAQRASAAVLAICVLVHLVTMVLAVRGGLSAAEILGRTQGSTGWFAFYLLFAAAVSVHAPIGLRSIAAEWTGWRGRGLDLATLAAALALFAWAVRAMWGVFR
jgi:fumarate reductase subunit C